MYLCMDFNQLKSHNLIRINLVFIKLKTVFIFNNKMLLFIYILCTYAIAKRNIYARRARRDLNNIDNVFN